MSSQNRFPSLGCVPFQQHACHQSESSWIAYGPTQGWVVLKQHTKIGLLLPNEKNNHLLQMNLVTVTTVPIKIIALPNFDGRRQDWIVKTAQRQQDIKHHNFSRLIDKFACKWLDLAVWHCQTNENSHVHIQDIIYYVDCVF